MADARVHLAIPQQTGFFREQQKPSASVLLHLRGGRLLDRAQIAGIVHLVSASVPELNPRAVSVLDQTGKLLSSNEEGQGMLGMDAQQLQYKQGLEANLATRIQALLEPVLGRENLRTTVTADLDFSQSEQTSEAYAPNQGSNAQQTLRSHVVNESNNGANQLPTGVPGAVSNQPPVPAQAPINGASAPLQPTQQGAVNGNGNSRRDETRNYEVDKTVRVVRNATGTVKRLTAAVVLNHRSKTDAKGKTTTEALPQAEVERITALVREAIGFSQERGDSLQVVSAPFVEHKIEAPDLPIWQQPMVREVLGNGAVPLALVLVALIVVFGMVRPAIRAAYPSPVVVDGPTGAPGATLSEVVGDQAALPEPVVLPKLEAPLDQTKLERARQLARENPLAMANIVRAWINGEEPEF